MTRTVHTLPKLLGQTMMFI